VFGVPLHQAGCGNIDNAINLFLYSVFSFLFGMLFVIGILEVGDKR